MSKGKFEPGKRVLLLGAPDMNPRIRHLVRTVQILLCEVPFPEVLLNGFREPMEKRWVLQDARSLSGRTVCWSEPYMILLDPDESPEQSAEAMRDLYSLPQKVTA